MKVLTIIMGVLLVIGGFYSIANPLGTFVSLWLVIGILLMMTSFELIAKFFRGRKSGSSTVWELMSGILTLMLSILLLVNVYAKLLAGVALLYVFAGWLVASGVLHIAHALQVKKEKTGKWFWMFLFGILGIATGIYGFFSPLVMAWAIGWMIGFIIMVEGFNLIAVGASMGKESAE